MLIIAATNDYAHYQPILSISWSIESSLILKQSDYGRLHALVLFISAYLFETDLYL